jgi:hypothetical protein
VACERTSVCSSSRTDNMGNLSIDWRMAVMKQTLCDPRKAMVSLALTTSSVNLVRAQVMVTLGRSRLKMNLASARANCEPDTV